VRLPKTGKLWRQCVEIHHGRKTGRGVTILSHEPQQIAMDFVEIHYPRW
jgi:hypothetical protein